MKSYTHMISFYGTREIIYMYFVYLLENKINLRWYIGFSEDLKTRLKQHNAKKGAKFTKTETWKLIYFECYANKKDAIGREKFLKSGSGRKYLKKQLFHYLNSRQDSSVGRAQDS